MSIGLEMGNKTITVRFDPELYKMIKSYEMSSSDIIRQGVRMFFNDENHHKNNWSTDIIQDLRPDIHQIIKNNSLNESYESRNQSSSLCNSIDETLQLMDKLKNEINQLDQELETWIDEYNEIDNSSNNYSNQDNYKHSKWSPLYQF